MAHSIPMLLEAGTGYWLFEDGTIINWGLKMAYNIFDLTYMVARELNIIKEGTATGGSTTTLIDTINLTNEDDYWNLGTVWVIYDSAGAGAAPEGEYGRISDFVKSTSVVTIPTITAAIAAGDRYAIADNEFTLDDIIGAISQSLREIKVVEWDETTNEIAAAKTEYALPLVAKEAALHGELQVFLETVSTDADDGKWMEIYDWWIEPSAATVTGTVHLPDQYTSGNALGLLYSTNHGELWAATSTMNELVSWQDVVYPATLSLLWSKHHQTEDPKYLASIVKYEGMVELLKTNDTLELPKKPTGTRVARKVLSKTRRTVDTPSSTKEP